LGFEHGVRVHRHPGHAPRPQPHDAQHDEPVVEERHVDRKAHRDRVHGPRRLEQQRAVDAVPPEQTARAITPRRRHLEAGEHFPVADEPGHEGTAYTLKRISRTSPSATS
jgi:hypothetical protein